MKPNAHVRGEHAETVLQQLEVLLARGRPSSAWSDASTVEVRRELRAAFESLRAESEQRIAACEAEIATLKAVVRTQIAERQQAESALRESHERRRLTMENLPAVVFELDPAGALTYVSRSWERSTGEPVERALGNGWLDFVHPDDRAQVQDIAAAAWASGQMRNTRYRYRSANGSYQWVYTRVAPVKDEHEVVLRWIGSTIDIDHLVQVEHALRDARDELEVHVRERTQELEHSREQLHLLSLSLQAMLEEERARIAREIHDELGARLTAIKLDVSWWASRMAGIKRFPASKVKRIIASLDSSIRTVRRIASDLRPSILDHMGLAAAIEWLAQEFQESSGIACRIALDVEDGQPALNAEQATALFRIVQETLTNVARHAGARMVHVTMQATRQQLTIMVRDDGVGITDAQMANTKSLGLIGMQERALGIGAQLHIRGAPGEGTTVAVRLPLEHHDEEQGQGQDQDPVR